MFSSKPNYSKLKTNLRLVINRLQLKSKKKAELAQKARREIADFIANGKTERAKIKVEQIIREDYLVEALEMLENLCEILISRFGLLENSKTVDPSLAEPISSIIWVSQRLESEIKEFKDISVIFTSMYGKQYIDACKQESVDTISEKLKHKMGVQPPPKILVEKYLIEIAKIYEVPYTPDSQVMLEDAQSKGIDALLFDGISTGDGSNLPPRPPGFIGYPQPPMVPTAPSPFTYPTLDPMSEKNTHYTPGIPGQNLPHGTPSQINNFPASLSYDFPPGEKPIAPSSPGTFNYSPPPKYNDLMREDSTNSLGNTFNPANEISSNANTNAANSSNGIPTTPAAAPKPLPRTNITPPGDPKFNLPSVPSDIPDITEDTPDLSDNIDFDDLTKRFEELKKKR